MDETQTKWCSRCDTAKPVSDYYRDKRAKDGKQARCKACEAEYNAEYHAANRDRIAERKAKHRAANRERIAKYAAEYRAALAARTPEERMADLWEAHPDGEKACTSCGVLKPFTEFYDELLRRDTLTRACKDCDTRKRTARRQGRHVHAWAEWELWNCYVCGSPYEEIEHLLAESNGGEDKPYNTAPSCQACNRGPSGKFARPMLDFMAERYDLQALAHLEVVGPNGEDCGFTFGEFLEQVR